MLFRGHCLFYMIGKFSKLPYHTKSPPGGMHTRTNGKYRLIRKEEITNIHLKKYLYKRFALWYNVKIKERTLVDRYDFKKKILEVILLQNKQKTFPEQSCFKLHSEYQPTGDQPQAIEALVKGFKEGNQFQTLLGVTGSGKTFTMANVIQKLNLPTLVIAHNKTLAAQLYGEFKEFFPENAVEYFVSYYDYYQPEAYVPSTDTYIEKDSAINDEIDKLRHSATAALTERKDVIIVASVSCIYGLGDPIDYQEMTVSIRPGQRKDRDDVLRKLVDIQYTRNDMDFKRGTFRVRGDVVEIYPVSYTDKAVRVEFFGDEIERITEIDPLTGEVKCMLEHVVVFPASHYVVSPEKMEKALGDIEEELEERVRYFRQEDQLLEAQRISERTNFDIEMMRETGFCSGIENYSRHLAGLAPGSTPNTLMDYFPEEFLIIVDESHITIPQVRGMFSGDRSRKQTLVNYGFRLPSALDNRPLNFDEFESKIDRMMFVSATPSVYEEQHELLRTEQVIRPTGLLDPEVSVRPVAGQIDDLVAEVKKETEKKNKVLVTTLTKRMAEDLTDYMRELGIRVKYLHSDIDTLERAEIIRDMRMDVFDVLVGINLLREGLDIPEITLVAILDADKEGFLRSETSLIQTIGRAARNSEGHVVMYADRITESMERAIGETNRRRQIQMAYNEEHGITPTTIQKKVRDLISISKKAEKGAYGITKDAESMDAKELSTLITKMSQKMNTAAVELNFELAAELRDQIFELKKQLHDLQGGK
jgi:excinuclease ABC subunit B